VGETWADHPNPPSASIAPGGGWPGTIRPESLPNVLFLGDGFSGAERGSFEQITNSFVRHMKTTHSCGHEDVNYSVFLLDLTRVKTH
jgi:hypothetical protein